MKHFLLFFLLLPFAAHAQTYTLEAARVCAGTRWVAQDVMTRRQSGEPYERVMRDMQSQSAEKNKAQGVDMVYFRPLMR